MLRVQGYKFFQYILGFMLAMGGLGAAFPLCHAQGSRDCVIGVVLPLTGRGAGMGESQLRVIQMLEPSFRARLRGTGIQLKLKFADSRGDPAVARMEMERLVGKERAVAILTSGLRTEHLLSISKNLRAPVMSCSVDKPFVAETGRWLFQTAPSYKLAATALLRDMQTQDVERFYVYSPQGPNQFLTYLSEIAPSFHIAALAGRAYPYIVPRGRWQPADNSLMDIVAQQRGAGEAALMFAPRLYFPVRNWQEVFRQLGRPFYLVQPSTYFLNVAPEWPRSSKLRVLVPSFLFPETLPSSREQQRTMISKFAREFSQFSQKITHTKTFISDFAAQRIAPPVRSDS